MEAGNTVVPAVLYPPLDSSEVMSKITLFLIVSFGSFCFSEYFLVQLLRAVEICDYLTPSAIHMGKSYERLKLKFLKISQL